MAHVNSCLETVLNYAFPLPQEGVKSLFQGACGHYGRVVRTVAECFSTFSGIAQIGTRWGEEIPRREITEESIARGFFDLTNFPSNFVENKEGLNQKLSYVLHRIQELAKKMGITQKVRVYSSASIKENTHSVGSRLSSADVVVFVSIIDLFCLSEKDLDFLLSHELSHYSNYDYFKKLVFSTAILSVDGIAYSCIGPFAPFLIEGTLTVPLENYCKRLREKQADENAMRILESTEGALKWTSKQLERNTKIRADEQKQMQEDLAGYFNAPNYSLYERLLRRVAYCFSKETVVSHLDLSLHNRCDLEHPPILDRLQYIRDFKIKRD